MALASLVVILAQRLLRRIVDLVAAVLSANAPAPTADEVITVTTVLVPEPVAACVNDCVLFRHVDPRHDTDGRRAGLADLEACPVCFESRYVKGTKRNRKTFWYQQRADACCFLLRHCVDDDAHAVRSSLT